MGYQVDDEVVGYQVDDEVVGYQVDDDDGGTQVLLGWLFDGGDHVGVDLVGFPQVEDVVSPGPQATTVETIAKSERMLNFATIVTCRTIVVKLRWIDK